MKYNAKIIGTGMFVPNNIITNFEIEKQVSTTTNDWIVKNTGINERRICSENENSSFLGSNAGKEAIINSKLNLDDIDMLIVATTSPDKTSPSTACIIKNILHLDKAIAFDVSAVCSGFLFAMSIAEQYISSGSYQNILVIGVDTFSKITDWGKRDCVFFGDGAGAVVISKSDEVGFMDFNLYSDNFEMDGFICEKGENFKMDTKKVYNSATKLISFAINEILKKNNMTIDDIDYLIPHQPSIRILNEVSKLIGLPKEKLMTNMGKYANTVSATIPILLHETWNKFKNGDKILFAAIGSGWTYGSSIYVV